MLGVTQDPVLLIHPHLVVTVNLLFHTQTEYFHGLFRVIRATIHAANVASVQFTINGMSIQAWCNLCGG